jgi:Ca2+-binding EF-hand superfamily protein
MVVVTCVEHMIDGKAILKVQRAMATARVVRALKLIRSMKVHAHRVANAPLHQTRSWKLRSSGPRAGADGARPGHAALQRTDSLAQRRHEQRREEYFSMFECFDVDGSGSIGRTEISKLLLALRICEDDTGAREMMRMIDHDNSGQITFEEFFGWVSEHGAADEDLMTDDHVDATVDDLFAMVDKDGSGCITHDEFYTTISSLNVPLTTEDCVAIVNEADEDGNGVIDKEEFAAMMRRHTRAGQPL